MESKPHIPFMEISEQAYWMNQRSIARFPPPPPPDSSSSPPSMAVASVASQTFGRRKGGGERTRTPFSRVLSERQRRKVLGDSLLALKELLPAACKPSSLSSSKQMDKCTILKEASKHIRALQAELKALVRKKEEAMALLMKGGAMAAADLPRTITLTEPLTIMKNNSRAQLVVDADDEEGVVVLSCCNSSNVFVNLKIVEGRDVGVGVGGSGSRWKLSSILEAMEKANMDIVNVTAWRTDGNWFYLMAHGKMEREGASLEALREYLTPTKTRSQTFQGQPGF